MLNTKSERSDSRQPAFEKVLPLNVKVAISFGSIEDVSLDN